MLKRNSLSQFCFRPALPRDRRQIRLLLRSYHLNTAVGDSSFYQQFLKPLFGLGLLFGLLLHWLEAIGGFALAGLFFFTIAITVWFNLQLTEWRHYWVIERNDQLLACGQLKSYGSWALLSDVVVAPNWRRRGVGSQLIYQLAATVPQTIYLACHPKLVSFYQPFGFQVMPSAQVSLYLKQELGVLDRPRLVVLQRLK